MIAKHGLLAPLRRGARDFASAVGPTLLASKSKQVLLTDPGELPWRTNFGAGLGRLRHQNNDAVLRELARVAARDALNRWMSGAQATRLELVSTEGVLTIRLKVDEALSGDGADVEGTL